MTVIPKIGSYVMNCPCWAVFWKSDVIGSSFWGVHCSLLERLVVGALFSHPKPADMYCASIALLLGKGIGNPEINSELLASVFFRQCVAPLFWEDPGYGVSSVLCRRKLQLSFQARCHARLTLRVPQYPGNIFWRRGNAFTLKTH